MCDYEKAFKDLVRWIERQDKCIADAKKYGIKEGGEEFIQGGEHVHRMVKRAVNDVINHYGLDMG